VALALGLGVPVLVVSPPVGGGGAAWFGALASRFRCVGAAPCGGSLWLASPVPLPAPSVGGVQLALFWWVSFVLITYFCAPFFAAPTLWEQFLFLWFSLLGLFSCSYSRFFYSVFWVLFFDF
jgi:hypothetical protein